jgi:hypothetical protein
MEGQFRETRQDVAPPFQFITHKRLVIIRTSKSSSETGSSDIVTEFLFVFAVRKYLELLRDFAIMCVLQFTWLK